MVQYIEISKHVYFYVLNVAKKLTIFTYKSLLFLPIFQPCSPYFWFFKVGSPAFCYKYMNYPVACAVLSSICELVYVQILMRKSEEWKKFNTIEKSAVLQ